MIYFSSFNIKLINLQISSEWPIYAVWANGVGDVLTFIAFSLIPMALVYFIRQRRDIRYPLIFNMFALFIFLCGITHLLSVISFWTPLYRLSGVIKIAAGLASIVSAAMLIKIIPRTLELPGPAQIKKVNDELKKKTVELEKHNEFLQHLAYATAHDLREPARAVSIHAQMLLHQYAGKLDEGLLEELKYLSSESKRLYTLIDSVISYSYVESEEYKMVPVNLNRLAAQIKSNISVVAKESDATIQISVLPQVIGNENLLTVLFQNIITNSIKFKKPGTPPVINITADTSKGFATVYISDNGIGFDNRYNGQVFEIFKRLNPVGVYRGSGLGLAISKRIVELHNGQISASSQPGRGTTIIIELPTQ